MERCVGPDWKRVRIGDWVEIRNSYSHGRLGFVVDGTGDMYHVAITKSALKEEIGTLRYCPASFVFKRAIEGYDSYLRFLVDDALDREDKEEFLKYAMELRQRERRRTGK